MKKIIFISLGVVVVIFSLLTIVLLYSSQFYSFRDKEKLSPEHEKELFSLGREALKHEDVPVACLLLYKDTIIGRGFNTVMRDTNIAAHAEINAINDAISKIGFAEFYKLDRNKLDLITTYEPCGMCKAVILERRIKNVIFIQGKSAKHWREELWEQYQYEWRKLKSDNDSLQEKLFRMHPKYNPATMKE